MINSAVYLLKSVPFWIFSTDYYLMPLTEDQLTPTNIRHDVEFLAFHQCLPFNCLHCHTFYLTFFPPSSNIIPVATVVLITIATFRFRKCLVLCQFPDMYSVLHFLSISNSLPEQPYHVSDVCDFDDICSIGSNIFIHLFLMFSNDVFHFIVFICIHVSLSRSSLQDRTKISSAITIKFLPNSISVLIS